MSQQENDLNETPNIMAETFKCKYTWNKQENNLHD